MCSNHPHTGSPFIGNSCRHYNPANPNVHPEFRTAVERLITFLTSQNMHYVYFGLNTKTDTWKATGFPTEEPDSLEPLKAFTNVLEQYDIVSYELLNLEEDTRFWAGKSIRNPFYGIFAAKQTPAEAA